jgi:glycosyltransferase involved in cell wall biosynthesis
LARQVVYWAEHRDEANAIGARARRIAFSKYDRRSIAQQLAATFEEVCARRTTRSTCGRR